ncbi:TetR/AcrR family transcriptional regulator C-terminal domain-containing protein [Leifsonia shinshuensis]|uniref:AcrR family transcriptional regulator n=1 Tax=Leifsonia shinshuensis TaxID=150026 RepID=A0A853CW25_9MICO|nr:AcrR family transcriptional regulator [Leifsonia shinshuensis]
MTEALTHDHSKRLDRATIVKAGLEIAASPRNTSISIRALGTALGVDPTAVYRHFRGKDDLMKALLDEVQAVALAQLADAPGAWDDRLRALSRATLNTFVQYPAIALEATVLTTNGPAELATIEYILAAFAEAGLSGSDLVRHYALFASYVLSEAAGIARGRTTPSAASDDTRVTNAWFEGPLLVDPLTHSHIASVAAELRDLRDEDIFRMGVDAILDSAERAAS